MRKCICWTFLKYCKDTNKLLSPADAVKRITFVELLKSISRVQVYVFIVMEPVIIFTFNPIN